MFDLSGIIVFTILLKDKILLIKLNQINYEIFLAQLFSFLISNSVAAFFCILDSTLQI